MTDGIKTFTLAEARMLLPVLRSLIERAIAAKRLAEQAQQRTMELMNKIQVAGGMCVDVRQAAHDRAIFQKAAQQASDAIQEIDAIGVQVKDLDKGLLDFPFQMGSEVVLLCWLLGEDDIRYWHSTEDGFRGRQPLDERFQARPSRTRPN